MDKEICIPKVHNKDYPTMQSLLILDNYFKIYGNTNGI